MCPQNSLIEATLYPKKDSTSEVISYAKEQLPIDNINDLIAILNLHRNTLYNETLSTTPKKLNPVLDREQLPLFD